MKMVVTAVSALALAAVVCTVLLVGPAQRTVLVQQHNKATVTGMTHYGVRSRVQMLVEEKEELTAEDLEFLKHYDQCESCLVGCDKFEENHCDNFEPKKECLWDDLIKECDKCEHRGCQHVIEYIDTNEALNATFGDDDDAKASEVYEMAWRTSCDKAVDGFESFQSCIHEASSVSLAENCVENWLHPFPANMLSFAKKIAKAVGPPACELSYTGHECNPAPKPEENDGSCPQGFMCMPDPAKCESCACSCNTPSDKLKNLEKCLVLAKNPNAGAFCLATFFSQLPPDFVDAAINGANEPKGTEEHYDQIVAACGGDENGTETLTQCLEQVEYCIRPIQGKSGTFPDDESKFQPLCECFRNPEIIAACAGKNNSTETDCIKEISAHYVWHVHHKYCVDDTEAACNFQCEFPLPGFFGDIAKEAAKREDKKEDKKEK